MGRLPEGSVSIDAAPGRHDGTCAAAGAAPVVVLHQNLEPATAGHARSFRSGVGSGLHNAQAAAACLLMLRGAVGRWRRLRR
jgi:hypothetical protein